MKYIYSLICLFIFNFSFAQTITFSGKVVDELNEPVYAANVVIDASKGLAALTDFDGNFSINVEPGNYTVRVSYIGKETLVKDVFLNKDSKNHLLVLSPSNVEIEIVTVTAGKYEKKIGRRNRKHGSSTYKHYTKQCGASTRSP